jgi:aspartyl-tRNA(Asn)/glutamyl-tRNA(Gln) amidotransferase subunit C
MKVTEQDVDYVANLANLELTEQERQRMVKDLDPILNYIARLNELDTADVSPMTQVFSDASAAVTESTQGRDRSWREDEVRPCLPHDEALTNAPIKDKDFFKVPKVIER